MKYGIFVKMSKSLTAEAFEKCSGLTRWLLCICSVARVTSVATCGSRASVGPARLNRFYCGWRNLGESSCVEDRKHVAHPLAGSRYHVEHPADKQNGDFNVNIR